MDGWYRDIILSTNLILTLPPLSTPCVLLYIADAYVDRNDVMMQ